MMKFVGITRLNIVTRSTLGSFRLTKGLSLDEAKQLMFMPDKLRKRINYFRNFCLPTYKEFSEKTDQSYAVVLVNKDLPEPYRSEVVECCRDVRNVIIGWMDDDDKVSTVAHGMVRDIAGPDRVYSYRYDDDDALSTFYIDRITVQAKSIALNTVISLNRGFSLSRIGDDEYGLRIRDYPLNAFGLGIVSSNQELKTIMDLGPHGKIKLPTVHERKSLGWLSTVHDINDSRIGVMKSRVYSGEEIVSRISLRFPHISADALKVLALRRRPDIFSG